MLFEFLVEHRKEIIARTQEQVALRRIPRATNEELQRGIPHFLDQLISTLGPKPAAAEVSPEVMGVSAAIHGNDLLVRGFTVGQVVHDYGSVCQAVTELAAERHTNISVEEFRVFNLCLDNAIAQAVTEFSRQREKDRAGQELERLGFLAHELRNQLNVALLSYQALRNGTVAIGGSTGSLLGRSLAGLRGLVDRSLAEVRLTSGPASRKPVRLAELIEEVELAAGMDARERNLNLAVTEQGPDVVVEVDRELVAGALSNLLQNAFKFTRPEGHVTLTTSSTQTHARVDIADECGGLPKGKAEELFQAFEQRGADRSGLGLGLAISLRGVRASEGDITVRDIPGKGCVFTVTLPIKKEKTLAP